ncbi:MULTISPECIES: 7-cyano-7-deazaguanine synthase QueC [Desulfovibrio]|uniref:7-cyano-7-deazaguanine synthase QueC n=1 Tax=Desulfovibrio TaxID=872 RepID=UPI0026EBA3C7|nr:MULTISPECIES: 7-cyano-7-deazaguanine synthase QueC [Desulfovibrio]MDD6247490.1 7-cyano-7-deazaguanine synthase QueC [Desulfovibrio piger]MDY5395178.1 7-cyano-7-deazaguanine synthase QueC [Desulfovibrio sp.]
MSHQPPLSDQQALVIFSGGQDSATCLAWALSRFARVHTLGFDYGQRHSVELECRGKVRSAIAALKPEWQDRLGPDTLLDISLFRQLADTALTSDMPIEQEGEGIPNTFVPGRNLLFIMHAAAWAYGKNIHHLVLGVCESDSSGYPDCRDDSIKAMQVALNTGMDSHFVLHTPLMWLDKADTWRLAEDLGGMPLVDCILEQSHTCYEGTRGERYPWGYGCGQCPACKLRAHGYEVYLSRYHQK